MTEDRGLRVRPLWLLSRSRRAMAIVIAALLLTSASGAAFAQEFRATVTGRVTDSSGATIPGATVVVANIQTGEIGSAVSTSTGVYTLPFLKPGLYTLSAELTGFKKFTLKQLELEVGQTATINIRLELGALTEIITVEAEAVDTTRADRGQVIDNRRITEIPLNSRNPFMLSTLTAGITYNGPAIYQRPFDNGAIADWSVNGGQNRHNEFLLDGAPNNSIQGGNNIAYVQPVNAVQEFKIVTNSYDAQYGRTSGGIVNVLLKSGTNAFHGAVYEFYRRRWLDANSFLFNARGQEKPDHKLDQYGFQIDGPIFRNKTFFMFNYEGYRESTPNPALFSYPDDKLRRGDFSDYRDASGNLITIYDPATGREVNGRWVRDPFPGNRIPEDRIDPLARALLEYYPRPNATPPAGSRPWQSNYFFAPNLAEDKFYNFATKVDHVISDKTKMFVRYGQNRRQELRNSNGITTGPAQDGQLPLERTNYTGAWDWVRTMGPSFVLNLRSGLNQYIEAARAEANLGFDSTQIGFPGALVGQLPQDMFPRIDINGFTSLGRGGFGRETTTVYSVQPNFSWTTGQHNIRGGLDARLTWYTRADSGAAGMRLAFDDRFTRQDFQQGDPFSGSGLASFLLGLPTGDLIDNNMFPKFRWNYYAPWVQDDWRLTDRLTVNLGLRWDFNSPVWEEQNRLNYAFDPTQVNPANGRIDHTLYPGTLLGVRRFAGVDGAPRSPWEWDWNNLQPRVGVAFVLTPQTILRGGYGRYYMNPTGVSSSDGFSISTPFIASMDGNRTPAASLSNPFPSGVAQPPGASIGPDFGLGRGFGFSNTQFELPLVDQFSIGIQRQFGWRTSVELSYVGSRTRQQQSEWEAFNAPPIELRNQCDPTVGGNPSFCDERLPNPFYQVPGFEGTERFTSPTLSRWELSRPYPQFGDITQWERNDGRIWYNSLQAVVNKRTSKGLTLNGTYTFSRQTEQWGWLDPSALIPQKGLYWADRPHRLTLSGVYELPFGQGRALLREASPLVDKLVSGWELAGAYIYQSGRPWDQPDTFMTRDGSLGGLDVTGTSIRAVRPCTGRMDNDGTITLLPPAIAAGCTDAFYISRPSYSQRTVPYRSDTIRRPSFQQFDLNLAKTTRLTDNVRLQFRIEMFNVFNLPMYDERDFSTDLNSPNFGSIDRTSENQSNFPRQIQLGVKLLF